jgi:N6-adenosine-specific RNA methylase IME4
VSAYRTVVADPPWQYNEGWPGWSGDGERRPLPYPSMALEDIEAVPVRSMLAAEGYLFLWTTNRHLEDAYRVVRAWGCRPSTVLTWCKAPMGQGPGGMFAITTEFVIVAQRINVGTHAHGKRTTGERIDTTWFQWKRGAHSVKPDEFMEMVERVSPEPRLELFARRRRFGWDVWGDEAPTEAASQAEMGLLA